MRKKDKPLEKLGYKYRAFRHKIYYKEGYCKKVMVLLLSLFIIDMALLLLVW